MSDLVPASTVLFHEDFGGYDDGYGMFEVMRSGHPLDKNTPTELYLEVPGGAFGMDKRVASVCLSRDRVQKLIQALEESLVSEDDRWPGED